MDHTSVECTHYLGSYVGGVYALPWIIRRWSVRTTLDHTSVECTHYLGSDVGGVYALPWIIPRGAVGVHLTGAAPCNPEVVETRTVETPLFACRLSAVREG